MNKVLWVTGVSGSGKTAVTEELAKILDASTFSQDNFYVGRRQMKALGIDPEDFDQLRAIDVVELKAALQKIRTSQYGFINTPIYSFLEQARAYTEIKEVKRITIFEGHLALADLGVRSSVDLIIYIEVPEALAKQRRFSRDKLERGYLEKDCEDYYRRYVIPSRKIVVAQKKIADIVICGAEETAGTIATKIASHQKMKKLFSG